MTDPVLVLAWLTLAHLVADFVIQTNGIVAAKTSTGARAWRGVLAHSLGVAVCLIPVAVAFEATGLWALVVIVVSHVLIDRVKVVATRRAEASALADAARRREGVAPAQGLGRAWTPLPAAYFALDQMAHLAVIGLVWAVFLDGRPLSAPWLSAINQLLAGRDAAGFHAVVLGAVVIASLVIANVRGGALFVATLVRPIEAATGADEPTATSRATTATPIERIRGWSFRIGPLAGRVVADAPVPPEGVAPVNPPPRMSAPGQIGSTIGILERLLIVTLLLASAEAAIGLVIAAKTIARFRQLDDRDFAEYYLLGTLASVSVAVITALAARAALAA